MVMSWVQNVLQLLSALFVFALGAAVLVAIVVWWIDRHQTRHTIRRNYPLIGRFRWWFEHLGTFLRPYFFAMDREELPFNRSQRSWVYRAAKNVSNTEAFGSTRDLTPEGTVFFVNCAYPTLSEDKVAPLAIEIGPGCAKPYCHAPFFNISGMSYGAISRPAIQALSRGAAQAGVWLNTGEGGLSPYHLEGECDLVFQIGTAKYGVRDEHGALSDTRLRELAAIEQVRMFELKLSQGAKPGKGGLLPGAKVNGEISLIRGIPIGVDSISPNRHPEIADAEDLVSMLARIRDVTGKPVGLKLAVGGDQWLRDMAEVVARRGSEFAPDFISVDGAEGGTGAAPSTLMDGVGLPIHEALPLIIDTLKECGLRERVRVIASGKQVTAYDVAWALCVGDDFVVSARGFMFALGCIQALQCNRNTCPTGVTTHDADLQRGLVVTDKAQRVAHYARNMHNEVGIIAHACGVTEPRQLRREHARVVGSRGLSVPLSVLHPEVRLSHGPKGQT